MQRLLASAVLVLALVALPIRAEIIPRDAPSYGFHHPDDLHDRFGGNCTQLRAHMYRLPRDGVTVPPADQGPVVCDADGSHAAKQVETDPVTGVKTYTCRAKNGKRLIAGPHIEACGCPRVKYDLVEWAKTYVGIYIPSCNDTTGYWSPQQFLPSTGVRWCADKHTGGVIGEQTRGELVGC